VGKGSDTTFRLKPSWALLVAGWAGLLLGLGLALGTRDDPGGSLAPSEPAGTAARGSSCPDCPPCADAGVGQPNALPTGLQLTKRSLDGLATRGFADFTMAPWTSAPPGLDLERAPLLWTFMTDPDGRRLTLVRLAVGRLRVVVLPSAELMQEAPAVADAIALNSSRVLAAFDLGRPAALQVGTHALGEFVADEPTLSVVAEGLAMVNPKGYRGGRQLAAVQGSLPADGQPFSLVGTDDAGHLMLIHARKVSLASLERLLTRIGIKRAVVFGGVDAESPGVLYQPPSDDEGGQPLAQPLRPGAQPHRAAKMTLGTARLVIERRP